MGDGDVAGGGRAVASSPGAVSEISHHHAQPATPLGAKKGFLHSGGPSTAAPVTDDPGADVSDAHALTAADLFDLLWATLSDLLGSAATATLLRRSTKALRSRGPGLEALLISREGLEYRYVTPESWRVSSAATLSTFRELAGELSPILHDLTGVAVAHRLDSLVQFRRNNILFSRGQLG